MVQGKRTPEHVLRQIRKLRRESSLSLTEIASACGVSRTVVLDALNSLPGDSDETSTREEREQQKTSPNASPLVDWESIEEPENDALERSGELPDALGEDSDGIVDY